MDNHEFVDIINTKIRDRVVRIVEEDLKNEDQKREILKELSDWYSGKDEAERQIITKFIRRVYDCAAWRILHMLDNGFQYGGSFELSFTDDATGEKTQMIDPPDLYELHELYEPEFRK